MIRSGKKRELSKKGKTQETAALNGLKYWFRSVEQFAPWVRYIWFICDQDPPAWLNIDHPKLKIVRHEDYMPKEYLPSFNSAEIEINIFRIFSLSEHFVCFNDDTFILRPLRPSFFFGNNGQPKDSALLRPVPTTDLKGENASGRIFTTPLNNAEYINRDYDFRKCIWKYAFKWINIRYGNHLIRDLVLMMWPRFVGFHEMHLPQAYLKKSFEDAWKQDADILDSTSRHPIRHDQDVNPWLIRNRQLAEGSFSVRRPIRNAYHVLNDEYAAEIVRKQKVPMICLNDGPIKNEEFSVIRERIHTSFRTILGDNSSFEKASPISAKL